MSKKLTIEFVRKEFENENYKLLDKVYFNNGIKLNYVCPKGHKHSIRWNDWHQGFRCPYCSGKVKHTIDFIRKEFKKEKYILLSNKYKNCHKKLEYICPNKHKGNITWASWSQSKRCLTCAIIDKSGSNSPHWKGGISCEPYCFEWSSKEFKDYIKERDNYQCLNPDCWGNITRLSVHHIDYNKKNCDPTNLATLCTSCNSRANKDRGWHESWYKAIINRRYTT